MKPCYLSLDRTEIRARAREALARLEACRLCPRVCGADRTGQDRSEGPAAACRTYRRAWVSSHFSHLGEEDCLRGWRGSGTIFFSWCNLRCVFCQNHDISQAGAGVSVGPQELAGMMLELQAQGCHNINLVTPEHVVPQLLESLPLAMEGGLQLPIVYNSSGYDSVETLRWLDGIVDIYMPDFKIWDPTLAKRYLRAPDYPEVARRALREMHRQVGALRLDPRTGLAERGVLLRHLVMPNDQAGTDKIMEFLARELSADCYVNLMSQYRPEHRAFRFPDIARRPTDREVQAAYRQARAAGIRRFDAPLRGRVG